MLSQLLKEPLVHFLAIALLLFPLYKAASPSEENIYEVTVSEGRIAELANNFQKSKSRPPLSGELESLIQAYAINEMYLREARLLKLDFNDTVIDRRLRQKMEFLMSEMASLLEPTETELKEFYQLKSHRYQTEAQYTFEQVFVAEAPNEKAFKAKLEEQETRISQGEAPLGDNTFLPLRTEQQTAEQVGRVFGPEFAEKLATLARNAWTGPITSGFGEHFVKVLEYNDGRVKSFDEVRKQVLSDWRYTHSNIFKENYQKELVSRYTLNVAHYDLKNSP